MSYHDPMKPRFISSYQGAAEYELGGRRYEVRYMALRLTPYRSDVYASEVLPMVGCVYMRSGYADFPPADIMRHYPGYVAARYVPAPEQGEMVSRVEYQGTAPRTFQNAQGDIVARVYHVHQVAYARGTRGDTFATADEHRTPGYGEQWAEGAEQAKRWRERSMPIYGQMTTDGM